MREASKRSSVREWSTYLLKRVPEGLKADIAYEAAARATSHANVVREILCAHFDLDCPPRRAYLQPPFEPDKDTIFLRLQPELFSEIKRESASRNAPQRDVILDILKRHYNHNGGTPDGN